MAFFQWVPAAEIGASFALLLAGIVRGVHGHHLSSSCSASTADLDLQLVGARADLKNVLVQLLAEQRRLFRQADGLDEIKRLVHSAGTAEAGLRSGAAVRSAIWSRAPRRIKILL